MFERLKRRVTRTPRTNLDGLYVEVMFHFGQEKITEEQFNELSARIAKQRISIFPAKGRRKRRPVTQLILAHRRMMAATGPMPPALAAGFTTSEMSVLAVIAFCKGRFNESMDELADRAQVARRTVQKAIRKAEQAGLLMVIANRKPGQRNDYNTIVVVSREWLAWIYRGGCKQLPALDTKYLNSCNSRRSPPHNSQWKPLISRTSPGQFAIQSLLRR